MSRVGAWSAVSAALAMVALAAIPAPALAGSYAWTLTCKIGADGGSASASWNWLQDGQVIPGAGGTASCGGSGGGDRPAAANGFTATLTAYAGSKSSSKSVTVSFDPLGSFATSVKTSAQDSYQLCVPSFDAKGKNCSHFSPSITATFTMTS